MELRWGLAGIPDHEAVQNVGGRLGAARGPSAFRPIFLKMKGRDSVLETMTDFGDVTGITGQIEQNHQKAAEKVAEIHRDRAFSVIIGGSHDHGFSHLKGIREALQMQVHAKGKTTPRLGCINIDAHLDVRKADPAAGIKITSGSPFYLAIESGVLHARGLVEFGIQNHCNALELWQYVESKKVEVVPFEKLREGKAIAAFSKSLKRLVQSCDAIAISLDLDAAAQAFAPGVSAPQAEGFTSSEIIQMVEIAGREKKVVSLGIFELNPEHDIDGRTARLAATSAYHFVAEALRARTAAKRTSGVRILSRSK
ncbi:MAG: formimidoylglutamase [Bdellovibrionales bacterium]|nr:formimidoylglutamase [Bdellovibrionales bacterium]